jgi:TetR/AcrR family transcriptional regulator, tetracycline repressor protein
VTSNHPPTSRSRPAASDRPRSRGRPPSLSTHQVVEAALRVTREVGLDNLSMRALARELGVPPMTIYHYAPSREYLHALVVDDILGEIRVPGPDEGSWEERLRKLHSDARRVFATHPGVSAHFGDGGSREGARLADGVLTILAEGGFDQEAAVVCFATLFTFMTGQIDLDAMSHFVAHGVSTATLDNVTSSARFSREELFDLGYDAVMEGLKRTFLPS